MDTKPRDHTTANSIRHTLETIGKFTQPGVAFEAFFDEIEELKSDPYLCTDERPITRRTIRDEPAFIADDIKTSCGLIVEYVEKNFPHQVTAIKAALS